MTMPKTSEDLIKQKETKGKQRQMKGKQKANELKTEGQSNPKTQD
jgi:hypothetical protein